MVFAMLWIKAERLIQRGKGFYAKLLVWKREVDPQMGYLKDILNINYWSEDVSRSF